MFLSEYRIHLSKQVLLQTESFNPGLTIRLVVGIRKSLFIFILSARWPNFNQGLFLLAK